LFHNKISVWDSLYGLLTFFKDKGMSSVNIVVMSNNSSVQWMAME